MSPLAVRLAPHLRDTQHSETLLAHQVSAQLAATGKSIYRFGFGQSPFPVPAHIVEVLRASAHRKEYLDVQGLPALRAAVAAFHSEQAATAWHPEQVIVGAGSKILLFCLMAAIREADVALVCPGWVSYGPQATLAGHRVFRLQTQFEEGWRLTPAALEQFCGQRSQPGRPLVLVLNYPGNPDGLSYSATQLASLAQVLRSYGVIVISDEIYGLLHHRGEHVSLADYYPEGTVVTSGLSKWCGAGGWRLGIAHVPEQLGLQYFRSVIGICSETYSCASAPVQHAAVAAYARDEVMHRFVQRQRRILADIGNRCATTLRCADVAVHNPEGGFYLFPDFSAHTRVLAARGITTSAQLTQSLLEDTGVSLLPGSAFGMAETSLTARLAYVDFDGEAALRGPMYDAQNIDLGLTRLCDWLRQ